MEYLDENTETGRIILPDLVRAFALFGIVVVNVAYFAYPGEVTYHAGGLNTVFDTTAHFVVNSLFLTKSYTLFSFMFGVGLAYQMMSAERKGLNFGASYVRRMLGLIVLGVLHISLAFIGDILIVYGVLGLFLCWFRNSSQKVLVRTGITLIVIQVLFSFLMALSILAFERFDIEGYQTMIDEMMVTIDAGKTIYLNGSFSEVMARRWTEWSDYIVFVTMLQGPGIFGFFLLGLACVRGGVLEDSTATVWTSARRIYLPLGLSISVIGSAVYQMGVSPMSGVSMLGTALIFLGAPFSSWGYIGLIAQWSQGPITPMKAFLARGGTSSLTTYLLQSLVLSWIFCGYGLGLYSKLGAFSCILIAAVTGIATIAASSVWRTRFKRAPAEALLRRWTYLKS